MQGQAEFAIVEGYAVNEWRSLEIVLQTRI
jgi:hypothetical protein